MMNADGSLRQRHVSQPVSQPVSESSWYEEENVLKRIERRQRERQVFCEVYSTNTPTCHAWTQDTHIRRILIHFHKQEDLAPVDPKVFAFVIGLLILCCWAGWYFILQHGPHWVIHEMHQGHVANVIHYFNEHHELGTIDKLYNVRWPSLSFVSLSLLHHNHLLSRLLSHRIEESRVTAFITYVRTSMHQHVLHTHTHTHTHTPHSHQQGKETFLHHAVESNQPEIVKLLLGYEANPAVVDNHLQTPLHYAGVNSA